MSENENENIHKWKDILVQEVVALEFYLKLQKENERLNKLLTKELSENDEYGMEYTGIILLKREIELLKRKLAVAKQTLEFYADKNNWGESLPDIRDWYLIETTDRGNYARKVLLDIEVLK